MPLQCCNSSKSKDNLELSHINRDKRFSLFTALGLMCFYLFWCISLICGDSLLINAQIDFWTLQVHLAVAALAIMASIWDLFHFRLPHILTISSALIALFGYSFAAESSLEHLAGGILGFCSLKLLQIFCRYKYKKECIGSGDAILMVSLGSMVGIDGLALALLLTAFSAQLFIWIKKQPKIAFAPFLTFGALASLLMQLAVW